MNASTQNQKRKPLEPRRSPRLHTQDLSVQPATHPLCFVKLNVNAAPLPGQRSPGQRSPVVQSPRSPRSPSPQKEVHRITSSQPYHISHGVSPATTTVLNICTHKSTVQGQRCDHNVDKESKALATLNTLPLGSTLPMRCSATPLGKHTMVGGQIMDSQQEGCLAGISPINLSLVQLSRGHARPYVGTIANTTSKRLRFGKHWRTVATRPVPPFQRSKGI